METDESCDQIPPLAFKNKFNELPSLQTEQEVDRFVQARPDLWRAIQSLDLVLRDVRRVALEVLDEMRTVPTEDGAKEVPPPEITETT